MATLDFLRTMNNALQGVIEQEQSQPMMNAPMVDAPVIGMPAQPPWGIGPQEVNAALSMPPNITGPQPIKYDMPVYPTGGMVSPEPPTGSGPEAFLAQFASLFSPRAASAAGLGVSQEGVPKGVVNLPGGGKLDFRGLDSDTQSRLLSTYLQYQKEAQSRQMSPMDQLNMQLKMYQLGNEIEKARRGPKEEKVELKDYYDRAQDRIVRVPANKAELDPNLVPSSVYDDLMRQKAEAEEEKQKHYNSIIYTDADPEIKMHEIDEWNSKYPEERIEYQPYISKPFWPDQKFKILSTPYSRGSDEVPKESKRGANKSYAREYTQDNPLIPKTQADIDNAPEGSVILYQGKYYTK